MQQYISVVVPGIAGSKIYCNCNSYVSSPNYGVKRRLYPRKNWFFNSAIDNHLYECTNVTTKPLKTFWNISIYNKFITKLHTCPMNKVKIFSYDWRRDPTEIALDLLEFLKRSNLQNYIHLKLIGHSLGGLIIRICLEYFDGLDELNISSDKVNVYQCGTPMYGSDNIHDYNYGFELAAMLSSEGLFFSACPSQKLKKRDINKIKPFLFSVDDLRKIIGKTSNSLLYLLPTPMIKSIYQLLNHGQLRIREIENFDQIYGVHMKLANLDFPVKYSFYFNISNLRIETVYIPFFTSDILSKISLHDIRYGNLKHDCGLHLNRLLKSDGLVVPYSGKRIPYNCNVYVDESEKCSHAFLMNSTELWRIVLNSNNTFAFFNNTPNDEGLPGYDELFDNENVV